METDTAKMEIAASSVDSVSLSVSVKLHPPGEPPDSPPQAKGLQSELSEQLERLREVVDQYFLEQAPVAEQLREQQEEFERQRKDFTHSIARCLQCLERTSSDGCAAFAPSVSRSVVPLPPERSPCLLPTCPADQTAVQTCGLRPGFTPAHLEVQMLEASLVQTSQQCRPALLMDRPDSDAAMAPAGLADAALDKPAGCMPCIADAEGNSCDAPDDKSSGMCDTEPDVGTKTAKGRPESSKEVMIGSGLAVDTNYPSGVSLQLACGSPVATMFVREESGSDDFDMSRYLPGSISPADASRVELGCTAPTDANSASTSCAEGATVSGSGDVLRVTVISASGLENKDGFAAGKSDPYVICQIKEKTEKRSSFQTPVINDNLNPYWNHHGQVAGLKKESVLEFQVFDKDWTSSELLGKAEISAAEIYQQKTEGLTRELSLIGDKGQDGGKLKVKFAKPITEEEDKEREKDKEQGEGVLIESESRANLADDGKSNIGHTQLKLAYGAADRRKMLLASVKTARFDQVVAGSPRHEVDGSNSFLRRAKTVVHENAAAMTHTFWFDYLFGAVLIANAIVVGVECDQIAARAVQGPTPDLKADWTFRIAEWCFGLLFLLELFIRMASVGFRSFFTSKDKRWNFFDLILVSMTIVGSVIQQLTSRERESEYPYLTTIKFLRVVRTVRVIRVVRVFKFFRALRMLMMAIICSVKSCLWAFLMLLVIVYMVGICFTVFVGEGIAAVDVFEDSDLYTYWGTLPRSMCTLFMAFSGGIDWEKALLALGTVSPWLVCLFILYISFVQLAILNVVTGLFCQHAIETAKQDKDDLIYEHFKERDKFVLTLHNLFKEISGAVETDFAAHEVISFSKFKKSLTDKTMVAFFKTLDIEVSDAWTLFKLLDSDDSGEVDVEKFVDGCLDLKGDAKAIQLAQLRSEFNWLSDRLIEAFDIKHHHPDHHLDKNQGLPQRNRSFSRVDRLAGDSSPRESIEICCSSSKLSSPRLVP